MADLFENQFFVKIHLLIIDLGSSINHVDREGGGGGFRKNHVCPRGGEGGLEACPRGQNCFA